MSHLCTSAAMLLLSLLLLRDEPRVLRFESLGVRESLPQLLAKFFQLRLKLCNLNGVLCADDFERRIGPTVRAASLAHILVDVHPVVRDDRFRLDVLDRVGEQLAEWNSPGWLHCGHHLRWAGLKCGAERDRWRALDIAWQERRPTELFDQG